MPVTNNPELIQIMDQTSPADLPAYADPRDHLPPERCTIIPTLLLLNQTHHHMLYSDW